MTIEHVANDFDAISPAYDATRSPIDPATMEGLIRALKDLGVRRLLEVGIGTGRVARPLSESGFEVTGVDASRGMLTVARGKGLPDLVRGDAYHLPFRDSAFDATLFVHVLHLLHDPPTALHEGDRVGSRGAIALVHPIGPGGDPGTAVLEEGRRAVYRALAREGFASPAAGSGPRSRERLVLEMLPPQELVVLSDAEVTEPLARVLRLFEHRASRHALHVPPEALARAVESARAELGERTVTYRRIEALARWSRRDRVRRRR